MASLQAVIALRRGVNSEESTGDADKRAFLQKEIIVARHRAPNAQTDTSTVIIAQEFAPLNVNVGRELCFLTTKRKRGHVCTTSFSRK